MKMICLGLLGIAAYFLPAIIAWRRDKRNTTSIVLVNLLLGWTLIGWIVALIWACSTEMVDVAAEQRRRCACGKLNSSDARFCAACGKSLMATP